MNEDDIAEEIVTREYVDSVLGRLEPYRHMRASAYGDILESELLYVAREAFKKGVEHIAEIRR